MLTDVLTKYERTFEERTTASSAQFERARMKLAGGVAGNNKFMKPHPLYIREAHGASIIDIDGNEYIDLLMGAGPLILGHRPQVVVDALARQIERGFHFVLPSELEIELAERVCRNMAYVEELRFTVTGSEATIMAARAARAYTGRQKLAKFDGHFHGHAHDALSVSSIVSSDHVDGRIVGVPDWAGIPSYAVENLVMLPFDDIDETVRLIESHASDLAAVFLEPMPFSSLGGISPEPGFLERLRAVTRELGIVLIYDEVITGFRLGLGGAGQYFGVEPDLVAMGKIIGGGLPLGSYGGRSEIMERVVTPQRLPSDAKEKIFQSGTFSANPLSLAAGIATIDELERTRPYDDLRRRTKTLREGLAATCSTNGFDAQVTGIESTFHLYFTDTPIVSHMAAATADAALNRTLCFGLMAQGVFWPLLHGGFLSVSHTDDDVARVIDAADTVLAEMAAARVPVGVSR